MASGLPAKKGIGDLRRALVGDGGNFLRAARHERMFNVDHGQVGQTERSCPGGDDPPERMRGKRHGRDPQRLDRQRVVDTPRRA